MQIVTKKLMVSYVVC